MTATGISGAPGSLRVREMVPADAPRIDGLGREFCDYLRALGADAVVEPDVDALMRDCFGAEPAFEGLVAELDGLVVGYLLHCPWYDVDAGGRVLYVLSLFVTAAARGSGAGRALMERATAIARGRGAVTVAWTVYGPNVSARRFYERIGAYADEELTLMYKRV